MTRAFRAIRAEHACFRPLSHAPFVDRQESESDQYAIILRGLCSRNWKGEICGSDTEYSILSTFLTFPAAPFSWDDVFMAISSIRSTPVNPFDLTVITHCQESTRVWDHLVASYSIIA